MIKTQFNIIQVSQLLLLTVTSISIINTSLTIYFDTKIYTDDVNFDTIFQSLESEGKLTFTWMYSYKNSTESFLWGALGIIVTTHSVFMETAVVLGILTLCGAFLFATLDIQGNESDEFAQVTQRDLQNITKLAEDLSKFIGESLLAYMILYALVTPKKLIYLFSGNIYVIMAILLKYGILFVGLILGSIGASRVIILVFLCLYSIKEK